MTRVVVFYPDGNEQFRGTLVGDPVEMCYTVQGTDAVRRFSIGSPLDVERTARQMQLRNAVEVSSPARQRRQTHRRPSNPRYGRK